VIKIGRIKLFAILASLSFVVSFAVSAVTKTEEATRHIGNGYALLEAGKKQDALAQFGYAAQIIPKEASPNTFHLLAKGMLDANNYADSAKVYEKILKANPKDIKAINGLGIAYNSMGAHQVAQNIYLRGLGIYPKSLMIKNNLALSLILDEKSTQAIAILKESALGDNADAMKARENLALAYARNGNLVAARKVIKMGHPPDQAMGHIAILNNIANVVPSPVETKMPIPTKVEQNIKVKELESSKLKLSSKLELKKSPPLRSPSSPQKPMALSFVSEANAETKYAGKTRDHSPLSEDVLNRLFEESPPPSEPKSPPVASRPPPLKPPASVAPAVFYSVQLGFFKTKRYAENLKKSLSLSGLRVEQKQAKGISGWAVYYGKYPNKSDAKTAMFSLPVQSAFLVKITN